MKMVRSAPRPNSDENHPAGWGCVQAAGILRVQWGWIRQKSEANHLYHPHKKRAFGIGFPSGKAMLSSYKVNDIWTDTKQAKREAEDWGNSNCLWMNSKPQREECCWIVPTQFSGVALIFIPLCHWDGLAIEIWWKCWVSVESMGFARRMQCRMRLKLRLCRNHGKLGRYVLCVQPRQDLRCSLSAVGQSGMACNKKLQLGPAILLNYFMLLPSPSENAD